LVFENDTNDKEDFIGYVNSDYERDLDNHRSMTGYVFIVSQAPVSWRSTLQSIVALSITEVEYMATLESIKEAIWFQRSLDDLGVEHDQLMINLIT